MAYGSCRTFLVLGLFVVTGGCAMRVAQHDVSPAGQDDQRGYHTKLMKLEDRVTTRAGVERLLGPPELSDAGGRLAAYRWQRVRYEAYAFVPFEDSDDVETEATAVMYSTLLLEFDEAGVLLRHRKFRHRVEYGGPPTLPDLLAAWRDELAAGEAKRAGGRPPGPSS